jgi:hypothetical protein
MRRAPLRVLVIVDWPFSIGVSGRSRGVSGILKVVDIKDKLVRVHIVVRGSEVYWIQVEN